MRKGPSFFRTLRVLLGAAGQRAKGRRRRQQELVAQRRGREATDWGSLGFVLTAGLMTMIHALAAGAVIMAVTSGGRVDREVSFERQGVSLPPAETLPPRVMTGQPATGSTRTGTQGAKRPGQWTQDGKMVVNRIFFEEADTAEPGNTPETKARKEAFYHSICAQEAARIAARTGGDARRIEAELFDSLNRYGTSRLAPVEAPLVIPPRVGNVPGRTARSVAAAPMQQVRRFASGPVAGMVGSVVLLMWLAMMALQGEGLELDLQRRRHPMWEWLFSHPAPPAAVFLAEMLAPLAANPMYWSAPLFAGIVYGAIYGPALGLAAVFAVGIPVTLAAGCVGKGLEVTLMLRLAPRSRGAVAGLMSWAGYASMMLFLFGISMIPAVVEALRFTLIPASRLPWPWLALFVGGPFAHGYSFSRGVATCWMAAGVAVAGSAGLSVWSTQRGLAGSFAGTESRP